MKAVGLPYFAMATALGCAMGFISLPFALQHLRHQDTAGATTKDGRLGLKMEGQRNVPSLPATVKLPVTP